MNGSHPTAAPQPPPGLEPEDYYFEGPLLVFTAAYHLKRRYCCGSGCRHCPYPNDPARPYTKSHCEAPLPEAPPLDD